MLGAQERLVHPYCGMAHSESRAAKTTSLVVTSSTFHPGTHRLQEIRNLHLFSDIDIQFAVDIYFRLDIHSDSTFGKDILNRDKRCEPVQKFRQK